MPGPKKRYRSYKGEIGEVAPNLINRNFHADAPNQKWTTDILSSRCLEGNGIFLRFWICITEKIVSYNISEHPVLGQVMDMLDNAIMENFFGLIKSELLYLREFDSLEEFRDELENYI